MWLIRRRGWVPVYISKEVWSAREWNSLVLEVQAAEL